MDSGLMRLYLDHAAMGWPTLFNVDNSMQWGNPAASHSLGEQSRVALDRARAVVAKCIGATCDKQVIFNSGGTEGNNTVIKGQRWSAIVTTPTEHHAVLHAAEDMKAQFGTQVVLIPVDSHGLVRRKALHGVLATLQHGPVLVSISLVNNEIGCINDLATLSAVIQQHNSGSEKRRFWLHTDAVQAPGHVNVNCEQLGVDFLTLSAHKFHGPVGCGILFCREVGEASVLRPLLNGGEQQDGRRGGTEAVGAAVATAHALEDACNPNLFTKRVDNYCAWAARLWNFLSPYILAGLVLPTGPPPGKHRAPHHVSFCIKGAKRQELVQYLDKKEGILVSGGSACSSSVPLPSHVLSAIGVPLEFINGSLRITFGSHFPENTTPENVLDRLENALRRLLQLSIMKDY